jgi:hypothetical protein
MSQKMWSFFYVPNRDVLSNSLETLVKSIIMKDSNRWDLIHPSQENYWSC